MAKTAAKQGAAQPARRVPIRSCLVCRQTSGKRALLRVVRLPEKDGGAVMADPTGKRSGRGAYVCPDLECIGKAEKGRRFERALAAAPDRIEVELYDQLRSLADRASSPQPAAGSDTPMK